MPHSFTLARHSIALERCCPEFPLADRVLETVYHDAIESTFAAAIVCSNAPINDLVRDSEVPKQGDAKSAIPRARRRIDKKTDSGRVPIVTPTSFDCL